MGRGGGFRKKTDGWGRSAPHVPALWKTLNCVPIPLNIGHQYDLIFILFGPSVLLLKREHQIEFFKPLCYT